ncbi:MAG: hypothetical protein EOO38_08635 [Cytophagaceae bacterium]|nr:MAG: hypothetical protein EOO38_08635 [Cytophagaceae bacterium]
MNTPLVLEQIYDASISKVWQALTDASKNEVGTFASRLLLLCFHYDPNTGRYTLLVHRVLQAAGAGTVLVLAGMIVHFKRRERRGEDGHT